MNLLTPSSSSAWKTSKVITLRSCVRGQEDATRRVLGGLVDRGLLQSAEQILGTYESTPARHTRAKKQSDRPVASASCAETAAGRMA